MTPASVFVKAGVGPMRLKELECENVRLKRIVADQLLDSEGLKEIAKKLNILLS